MTIMSDELRAAAERVAHEDSCATPDAIRVAKAYLAGATWYDDARPPTEPGLYYFETCSRLGNPRPGFYLWKEGKPPQYPHEGGTPTKYFGPIRGAMQTWPMVPLEQV